MYERLIFGNNLSKDRVEEKTFKAAMFDEEFTATFLVIF